MSAALDEILATPRSEREYLEIAPPMPGWRLALEVFGWVGVPVIQAGRVIYETWRKSGLPTVAIVSPDLASELYFPLGTNGNKVLFRGHPYDEARYLPAADYNPYIFKDKIAELARVLISAGATSFTISANTESTAEMTLDASGSVEATVNGSFKAARKGATKVLWTYEGNGERVGALPDRLMWFNHEKDWQVIWDAAVHHRARSHSIEVFQNTNHELSGNLAAKFKGAGFQLGGSFRDTGSSNIKIDARFSRK